MYKVIIVDDEPKVSELIKNLIDWNGLGLFHMATAHDGFTALELIKKHEPDIIITDIRMPGFSGIDLIRNVKEISPNIEFIVISGYQHFDYAYNAIKYGVKDYLLKPLKREEINATLAKMVKKYTNQERQDDYRKEDIRKHRMDFVNEIFSSQSSLLNNNLRLESLNEQYSMNFIEGYFQAVIIKPEFEYHPENRKTEMIVLNKIQNIAISNFNSICSEMLCATTRSSVSLILNYSEENKKSIRKTLNNIIDESHMFRDIIENLIVSVGVGEAFKSFALIAVSAEHAQRAIEDRLVLGAGKINSFSKELHEASYKDSMITQNKRKKLVDLLEVLDLAGVESFIESTKEELLTNQRITGKYILNTVEEITEIVFFGLRTYLRSNETEKSMFEDCKDAINMQNSINSVFGTLKYYVHGILSELIENRKNESIRPINEAKKYINNNFGNDVSLEKVSQIVGFNAAYFSALFKKETGEGFVEYLTSVRIKNAKSLLADSDKTIQEICFEVGYGDVKHFTNQFKKLTSLTPTEYRRFHY